MLKKCKIGLVFTLILLTACGKKKVVYISSNATNTDAVGIDIDAEANRFVDTVKLDKGVVINIDADVDIPSAEQLNVYNVSRKYFEPSDHQKIIDKVFDGKKYSLEDRKLDYEPLIQYYEKEIANGERDPYDEEYLGMLDYYNFLPDTYEEIDSSEAFENESSSFRVMMNDDSYFYEFHDRGFSIWKTGWTNAITENGIYDLGEYTIVGTSDILYDENNNDIDEYEKAAQDFIKKLDLGGEFSVAYYAPQYYVGYADNEENLYGYDLIFYRNLDGVLVDGTDYAVIDKIMDDETEPLEKLRIQLDFDYNILAVDYEGAIKIEDKAFCDVNVIDLEKAKSQIIDEIINQQFPIACDMNYMTLEYMRVTESDEMTIIPVWCLKQSFSGSYIYGFLINALDGTPIDLKKELVIN